ncbi:MAG: hypothetical protein C5B49_03550 [Bdellovibrio sp.]|nr:MAG: hypothetical protein C5B49_03550 [Bdellovibrio sp.]
MSRSAVKKPRRPARPFDKYELYHRAVQSAETDVEFFRKTYRQLRKSTARILREDFCGTFALSCEWLKLNPRHLAVGVDLDSEPIEYGKGQLKSRRITDSDLHRLKLIQANVLSETLPAADIVVAMNFSYFIFLQRVELKKYFANVRRGLRRNGLFLLDIFGGSDCYDANEENTVFRKGRGASRRHEFTYFWEQEAFDPVSNRATFHIHFKRRREAKRAKVFTYDWRMWSIPEVRDLLEEVGFRKTHVYWEGTNSRGRGNGEFRRLQKGEACQSWIAYIAAEK